MKTETSKPMNTETTRTETLPHHTDGKVEAIHPSTRVEPVCSPLDFAPLITLRDAIESHWLSAPADKPLRPTAETICPNDQSVPDPNWACRASSLQQR